MIKPPTRIREQLRRHYEVERELAQRLLHSTRQQRAELYRNLYAELFERVPDHLRLRRRDAAQATREAVAGRMRLLSGHLDGVKTFLEFAPGDCRLAFAVCQSVANVYAVDISDQAGDKVERPPNFRLILYDGYQLDLPDDSVDLAFSYQFIEHLHPDDVEAHFLLVKRILKPGGAYIFCTPHRFSGPHDISRYFSDTPQGFHLKEWSYGELGQLLGRVGFAQWHCYRFGRQRRSRIVNQLNLAAEIVAGWLPLKLRRKLCSRLFQSVTMIARREGVASDGDPG